MNQSAYRRASYSTIIPFSAPDHFTSNERTRALHYFFFTAKCLPLPLLRECRQFVTTTTTTSPRSTHSRPPATTNLTGFALWQATRSQWTNRPGLRAASTADCWLCTRLLWASPVPISRRTVKWNSRRLDAGFQSTRSLRWAIAPRPLRLGCSWGSSGARTVPHYCSLCDGKSHISSGWWSSRPRPTLSDPWLGHCPLWSKMSACPCTSPPIGRIDKLLGCWAHFRSQYRRLWLESLPGRTLWLPAGSYSICA